MLRRMKAMLAIMLVVGCGGSVPRTKTVTADAVPERFEDLAYFVANHLYRTDPASAVSLGLHKFDGLLPDYTPAAIAETQRLLERDRDALIMFDTKAMPPLQQDERDVLLAQLRSRLFSLVDLDELRTDPLSYMGSINLDEYIMRDYAPAFTRAAGIIKLCTQLPAYLAQARTNLAALDEADKRSIRRGPPPRSWR